MKAKLCVLTCGQQRELRTFLSLISSALLATFGLLAKTADGASVPLADGPRVKAPSVESTVGEPFSLAYSFDYAGTLVATANGSCVPGYKGELFEGHLNEQGDVMRNASRWIAHVDRPGHIRWAIRVGNEHAGFPADLTCRQDEIYAAIGDGSNRGLIGKFDSESLRLINAIQYTVTPALNEAFFEFGCEPSLPFAISIMQDRGNSFAFSIISQQLQIALNKIYSLPAFATGKRDQYQRPTGVDHDQKSTASNSQVFQEA